MTEKPIRNLEGQGARGGATGRGTSSFIYFWHIIIHLPAITLSRIGCAWKWWNSNKTIAWNWKQSTIGMGVHYHAGSGCMISLPWTQSQMVSLYGTDASYRTNTWIPILECQILSRTRSRVQFAQEKYNVFITSYFFHFFHYFFRFEVMASDYIGTKADFNL